MRLDDLLTRNLDIQWFEGVALVQSVCRIAAAQSIGQEFPLPSQIQLAADGSVAIAGPSSGTGVPGAAHTLARMLSDDVPVRLRLVVTQATASECSYATLAEFSDALAYFERPDPKQILRQLYARAFLASPRAGGRMEVEPARVAADQSVPTPAPARRSVTRTVVLRAAVAALCAAVGMVAYGGGATTVTSVLQTLKQTLAAPGGTSSADATTPDARKSAGAQAGKRERSPQRPGSLRPAQDGRRFAEAADGRHSPVPTLSSLKPLTPSFTLPSAPVPIFADAEPIVVFASAFGAPEGGRLYSKEDASVTPPRSIYPKLPAARDPLGGSRLHPRTLLELTVATDGTVERVRLSRPPRDIHEFMLLSAAKAWRFEPAVADGRPVRFLHRVAVAAY